ncbi:MAG: hypothetical protein M3388_11220, partial [Acidobacteriota bacterium]|nr:hypothetical protein [Acidobacteriota bacterium]
IEKYDVKYKWQVKGGKIISGQNTYQIVFLRDSNEFNVKFEIDGLPKNCINTSFESSVIDLPTPRQVDEFGKVSQGDKKARMDNYFVELQNNPTAEGVIKLQNDIDLMTHFKFLTNYIKLRNFDKTRVSFIIADINEQQTQLWIIPAGAENPKCEDCLIIKAKDFDKLENLFRPKPVIKKIKKIKKL